jgi:hypothetical protein
MNTNLGRQWGMLQKTLLVLTARLGSYWNVSGVLGHEFGLLLIANQVHLFWNSTLLHYSRHVQ